MRGDKGRGTGSLKREARPLKVKDMAGAGAQKVLVVARMAQKEHAHIIHQIGVGADVEVEITAHAAAREDPDRTCDCFRRMTGAFKRFPSHFEELAVLWIKDCAFFWGKPEKIPIKILKFVQDRGVRHIIRPCAQRFRDTCFGEIFVGKFADRSHAITQIGPILLDRGGSRQMGCHTNDGNIIFACDGRFTRIGH